MELLAYLLVGSDDPIVPPINGRIIVSRLRHRHARLEIMNCGYMFVLTRPAETARRVERFIDRYSALA